AAAAAQDFGPLHEQSSIRPGDDRARQWPEETRPARAAVELGRGAEQRQGAARANKDAAAMLLVERASPRPLCPALAQDMIARRTEQLAPFGVGSGDLKTLCRFSDT